MDDVIEAYGLWNKGRVQAANSIRGAVQQMPPCQEREAVIQMIDAYLMGIRRGQQ